MSGVALKTSLCGENGVDDKNEVMLLWDSLLISDYNLFTALLSLLLRAKQFFECFYTVQVFVNEIGECLPYRQSVCEK